MVTPGRDTFWLVVCDGGFIVGALDVGTLLLEGTVSFATVGILVDWTISLFTEVGIGRDDDTDPFGRVPPWRTCWDSCNNVCCEFSGIFCNCERKSAGNACKK